ncbi:MAG: hypothetical protein ACFCU2_06325 [Acidimicrobiia bacterium]
MRNLARLLALSLAMAACSPADTTTIPSDDTATSPAPTSTEPGPRQCVRPTTSTATVSTGAAATDALFLSGEIFVCADSVVVVGESDINQVAAGAQLAAALEGPLLFPHPQLAAEIGRLKPVHVYILGDVEVMLPPGAEVSHLGMSEAVDAARTALGAVEELRLPANPDSSTIVETVNAISDRTRVVIPQTSPGDTTGAPAPTFDAAGIVAGLAVPTEAPTIWLVSASDPVGTLLAAATGQSVGARVMGIDPGDILGYPEVGTALGGRTADSLRFVGAAPESGDWELAVLLNGRQLPGGGYSILGDEQPKRYVAFYGHPETSALGVLGEQGPQETLDRMAPLVAEYEADGFQAIPTLEMMATVAAAAITDGDYSYEWPISTFTDWVDIAEEQGAYVILDLQPGRDDFLTQAQEYEEILLHPHVGLALDPEWRLKPDEIHLEQIGRVDASEVNLVVDWLADLVRDNGLPQKMIIVHQFREFMIENRATLKERPELQMVLQMDGQGPIATKDETWAVLTAGTENDHWRWGWKNFFDEDTPTPSPEHTMGKVPVPVFVSYQ